jgi:hypothetical protein
LLVAVHWSALSVVVTDIDPVPPGVPMFLVVGLIVRTPPDWLTVSETREPCAGVAVIIAVRGVALGLAAAVNCAAPLPVPLLPDVRLSHD